MITASNYLNNQSLLDLLCAYVADAHLKAKTPDQIRETFGSKYY